MNIGWHKKGKEWKEKRHLMSHITQTIQCDNSDVYQNCSVVEFELKEIGRLDIFPIIQKKEHELIEKEELEKSRGQKSKRQYERKLFEELSKKYKKEKVNIKTNKKRIHKNGSL